MLNISRLKKKLELSFGGSVRAKLREGCLYLSGELPDWNKVVRAGQMSVNKKKYTVVNDIKFSGCKIPPAKIPAISSNLLAGSRPHALVIGGGVAGCAIARELMRYKLDVMLLEKEHDVALHASGHNSGIIHPGIDLRRGQLKKKYADAGNRMFASVCGELNVLFRNTGQYLCFSSGWMKPEAFLSLLYWKLTGVPAVYISRRRLKEREPHLSDKIEFAIFFPTAGVVNPYELTTAYAENAANNGAKICFDTAVIDIEVWNGKIVSVLTNHGRIYPKLVINAAGVFAEDIARLAKDQFFSIHPKKSTNIILDKKAAFLVNTIASSLNASQAETAAGTRCKCGGIVHTVDGNLLADLNMEETYEKENFSTDKESIREVLSKQRKTTHDLFERDIITCFTGIHAATYEEDFIVSFGKFTRNIIHAAGIQSPGLTAAPAIAVDISRMAAEYLGADINKNFNPVRKAIVRAAKLPVDEKDALIRSAGDGKTGT
jgi:glycerol-3-phosphate dehydrogenase